MDYTLKESVSSQCYSDIMQITEELLDEMHLVDAIEASKRTFFQNGGIGKVIGAVGGAVKKVADAAADKLSTSTSPLADKLRKNPLIKKTLGRYARARNIEKYKADKEANKASYERGVKNIETDYKNHINTDVKYEPDAKKAKAMRDQFKLQAAARLGRLKQYTQKKSDQASKDFWSTQKQLKEALSSINGALEILEVLESYNNLFYND